MKLDILVFLGSMRASTPPKPARLGERVALHICSILEQQGHRVILIDPLELTLCLETEDNIFKPQFAFKPGDEPKDLADLADKIGKADAYVMISPEYNHAMSPALANLLNHFGSSLFSYKPSCIVTYSAGQWGGTRAAVVMRSFLSELGCLPVSAMIHIPKAQEVFNADGTIAAGQNAMSWASYFSRSLAQLQWWAEATHSQRERIEPGSIIEHFISDPSQRNAGQSN